MSEIKVKFSAETAPLQSGVKNVESSIKGLGSSVAGAVGAMGLVYGAVKGFQVLGSAIADASKSAASYETLSVSLEVLTGSAEKAAKLLGDVTKLGAETPLEMTDLAKATQTLLAFGVKAQDIVPTLKMLGDVGLGNAEKLQSLAVVFGQVAAGGRLMGGDVLQMINNGFNPLLGISKRLGKTMIETKEVMEKGGISFDMLKQSFIDATTNGGQFENMMAKIAQTTEGKLSNMSDNVDTLKRAFGTGFNDGLKDALDAVNGGLPKLTEAFTIGGKLVGNAISDAVNGDAKKFVSIGMFIGDLITEGLKSTLRATTGKLGSLLTEGLLNIDNAITGEETDVSGYIKKMDRGRNESILTDTIKAAQQRFKDNLGGDVADIKTEEAQSRNKQYSKTFTDGFSNAWKAPVQINGNYNPSAPHMGNYGAITNDPLVNLQKTSNSLLGDILTATKNNKTQTAWQ